MRYPLLSALAAVGTIVGCASSTGPAVNVGGAWSYQAQNLTGNGGNGAVTCTVTNMTLSLTQTGSTFAGTYSGASGACVFGLTHLGIPLPSDGAIVNGKVHGDQVSFDIGSHLWSQSGRISSDSMQGTASLTITAGLDTLASPILTANGQWSAVKQ